MSEFSPENTHLPDASLSIVRIIWRFVDFPRDFMVQTHVGILNLELFRIALLDVQEFV